MKFRWMTVALVLFAAVAVHAQDVDIIVIPARRIGGRLAPDTVTDLEIG